MPDQQLDYQYYYLKWHSASDEYFADAAVYWSRKLEPFMPGDRTAAVLDIGCGMGFAIAGLQRLGYQNVRGIEASPTQAGQCARRNLPVELVPAARNACLAREVPRRVRRDHGLRRAGAHSCRRADRRRDCDTKRAQAWRPVHLPDPECGLLCGPAHSLHRLDPHVFVHRAIARCRSAQRRVQQD